METLTVKLPKGTSKAACDRVKTFIKKSGADSEIIAIADGSEQAVVFTVGDNISKSDCCLIGIGIAAAILKTF